MPVWITDPEGRISFLNARAADLLGVPAARTLGLPCHEVIRGLTPSGLPHCARHCPLARRARLDREIDPVVLLVPSPEGGHRTIELIVISDRRERGREPWLVHCVRDITESVRLEEYVTRLASRSLPVGTDLRSSRMASLTLRQSEVLALLARDETLQGIALELGVSYATVRNHVQQILTKLEKHSIPEAVAQYLLRRT